MVMQPKLLLLDEPTSQLDPIAAGEFFDTLKRINTELGTTIIVTEHRTEALFPLVDEVVFMRGGGIFYSGTPRSCAKIFSTAAVIPARNFTQSPLSKLPKKLETEGSYSGVRELMKEYLQRKQNTE